MRGCQMDRRVALLLGMMLVGQNQVNGAPINQAGRLGLGAIFGDPTGFTGKYWLSEKAAIDATAAWHFSPDDDRFEFHADYLLHFPLPLKGLNLPGQLP